VHVGVPCDNRRDNKPTQKDETCNVEATTKVLENPSASKSPEITMTAKNKLSNSGGIANPDLIADFYYGIYPGDEEVRGQRRSL
jgi:hypothetical protein